MAHTIDLYIAGGILYASCTCGEMHLRIDTPVTAEDLMKVLSVHHAL